jgi:hypothetical protein
MFEKDFDIEREFGENLTVEVEGTVRRVEHTYGADADGNRGEARVDEEIDVTAVRFKIELAGEELTFNLEHAFSTGLLETFREMLSKAADEEVEAGPDPDDEYDRQRELERENQEFLHAYLNPKF